MPERDRRGAEKRGRHAETLAAMWLRLKGYSVLETRLRLPVGEIDIIARRGAVIAFIEVKQRAQHDTAKHAVSHASWRRISRAAEVWLARHPDYRRLNWRYDLITVAPHSLPKHAPDYWRP